MGHKGHRGWDDSNRPFRYRTGEVPRTTGTNDNIAPDQGKVEGVTHGRTGASRYTGGRSTIPGRLAVVGGRGALRGRVWIFHRSLIARTATDDRPDAGDVSGPAPEGPDPG